MNKSVIFLDYDGVVNNILWDSKHEYAKYNYPDDNCVNDFQAVQWISQLCEDFGLDIVVTSSWRLRDNYADCLLNAGLRSGSVIGRTNIDRTLSSTRGEQIISYLEAHPEIEEYIIIDDECHDFDKHPSIYKHFYQVTGDGFYYTAICDVCKLIISLRAEEYLNDQIRHINKINNEHDREA